MDNTLNFHLITSPLGPLRLLSNGSAVVRIEFPDRHGTDGVAQVSTASLVIRKVKK